jgi:small subunit ribosomal protein S18
VAEYDNNTREGAPREGGREERPDRDGGDRRGGPGGGRGGGRRDFRRQGKVCQFCAEKAKTIDYKEVRVLRQYINERGRIHARRKTGTCARHQRMLARAIKWARQIALLPYTAEHVRPLGS